MKYIWNEQIDTVLSSGQSLEAEGVRNFVLEKPTVLRALDILEVMQIAILGGDVYVLNEGRFQSNYDNWFCDRGTSETQLDYVKRSISRARDYIRAYPLPDAYFALVPRA